jgi:hypothetical protein
MTDKTDWLAEALTGGETRLSFNEPIEPPLTALEIARRRWRMGDAELEKKVTQ